jgi:hypothetical protein
VFSTSKSSYTPSTDSKYRTNKYNTCKVILMMTVTWKLSEVFTLLLQSTQTLLGLCLHLFWVRALPNCHLSVSKVQGLSKCLNLLLEK